MTDQAYRHDKGHASSGVAPVLFSASSESVDTAIAATDARLDVRSPFGPDALRKVDTAE